MVEQSEKQQDGMNPQESRAAFSLAGIYALRMLGLFLILPVFALYAERLDGVTPMLVGLAIGAYGLTQALLQIPFGMLSDRIGRKPVILGGLLIFAIGSVVAAMADSIWGVILGRALQGSGAIAAAVMALAADLSREQHRTKVMAAIGMSIGADFTLALILGPVLNSLIGVQWIFWLTAVLALGGIGITLFLVPTPETSRVHGDAEAVPAQFGRVLSNVNLLRLDLGIFVLHLIITSIFLAVPLVLRDMIGMESSSHWIIYLPVLLLSILFMVPFIVVAEKRNKMKPVFLGAVLALAIAQLGLYLWHDGIVGLSLSLLLFLSPLICWRLLYHPLSPRWHRLPARVRPWGSIPPPSLPALLWGAWVVAGCMGSLVWVEYFCLVRWQRWCGWRWPSACNGRPISVAIC